MFLGRHVAEHRGAVPADLCRADGRRNMVVTGGDVGGEGAERVERGSVALFELARHVVLNLVHGHVARAFDNHLHAVFPGNLRELAERVQFSELGRVVGVGQRPRAKPVAERNGHVVCGEDFADFAEVRVEEVLLVMAHLPQGEDGTAAAHDTRGALGSERDVFQQQACMNREVVHALFRLLDERVAVQFPREFFGLAVHLFERLVNRHCSYRYGTVADNPFTRLVDVLAGGKVHHGVGTPAHGPGHLFDFFFNRRGNGRIADVAVDFREEAVSDNHRFAFRVVDVSRQNRTARGDFVAHELGGNGGAGNLDFTLGLQFVKALVFTYCYVFHFLGDDSLAGVVELRQVVACLRAERVVLGVKAQMVQLMVCAAGAAIGRRHVIELFGVATFHNPRFAETLDALRHVELGIDIAVWAARVVHRDNGRLGVFSQNFAHSHADVRVHFSRNIHLAGVHKRFKERIHQILAFPTATLLAQVQGVFSQPRHSPAAPPSTGYCRIGSVKI